MRKGTAWRAVRRQRACTRVHLHDRVCVCIWLCSDGSPQFYQTTPGEEQRPRPHHKDSAPMRRSGVLDFEVSGSVVWTAPHARGLPRPSSTGITVLPLAEAFTKIADGLISQHCIKFVGKSGFRCHSVRCLQFVEVGRKFHQATMLHCFHKLVCHASGYNTCFSKPCMLIKVFFDVNFNIDVEHKDFVRFSDLIVQSGTCLLLTCTCNKRQTGRIV